MIGYNQSMIKSNLGEILKQKNLSIRQVSRDTGIRFESLRTLVDGSMERIPKAMLDKLCNYLGVTVGQIIEYED